MYQWQTYLLFVKSLTFSGYHLYKEFENLKSRDDVRAKGI